MHIRVYCHLHRPDSAGGASVFTDFVEGLAGRGHDVELMTAVPHYPTWSNTSGVSLWRRHRSRMDGVDVTRHGFIIPRTPSQPLWRAAGEGSYALSLTRSIYRNGAPDAIVAFVPMLASAVAARLDARKHDAPLWINVQDLSGRAAAGYSRGLGAALTRIEDRLLSSAELVTTIAPTMTEQLAGIQGPEITTFPNWLHSRAAEQFAHVSDENDEPNDRRRPVRLLYAGNIGRKQGLDRIIETLATTSRPFEFEVCGTGAGAPEVDRVFPADDPRFRRRPFLDEPEFLERLRWCDVFVVPELPSNGPSFLPSKLLPSIAAGTPILSVVGDNSALLDELTVHQTGRTISWDEVDELIPAADALRAEMRQAPLPRTLSIRAQQQSSAAALTRAEALLTALVSPGQKPDGEPAAQTTTFIPNSDAPKRESTPAEASADVFFNR